MNCSIILNYLVQCLRIYHNPKIKHKIIYFWKCLFNYIPNYVMIGLVLYTFTESSYLKQRSTSEIILEEVKYVLQISVYSLVTTK